MNDEIPNPGSDEAIERGCICPAIDNQHGRGCEYMDMAFWINLKCPLHGGLGRPVLPTSSFGILKRKGEFKRDDH